MRSTSFVAAVGTGGTVTGVGEVLKERKPGVQIVAGRARCVAGSFGRSARARTRSKARAPASSRRSSTRKSYDEVIRVTDADAIATARRLAREEGMLVGISAGANVLAALQLANRPEFKGKTIVTVGCDTGERYLSNPVFSEQDAIVVEPALVS